MRKFTIDELKGVHIIQGRDYAPEDLFFCPDAYRVSFVKISQWKQSARKFLKNKYGSVLCTIGDQWTDLIEIKQETERARLDEAYSTSLTPYLLFKLYDGICSYGIKLKSDPIIEPKFVIFKVGQQSSQSQSQVYFTE